MKTFHVGVIGIGDISDVYIRNLQNYPIVRVLACAGRSLHCLLPSVDREAVRGALRCRSTDQDDVLQTGTI